MQATNFVAAAGTAEEGATTSQATIARPGSEAGGLNPPRRPQPRRTLRRKLVLTTAGLALTTLVSYFLWESFLYIPPEKDSSASLPGIFYPSQGNHHLPVGMPFTHYNSNPPTSGPHWLAGKPYILPSGAIVSTPPQWGVYAEELPNESLVHSMEHGGVVIWYRPRNGCDARCVNELRLFVRRYLARGHHLVLVPSGTIAHPIAATAWTRLENFDQLDTSSLAAFISAHERRYNPEDI